MCMEDVQIGRLAVREQKLVTVTDVASVLVPQDPDRYSLMMQNIGANPAFLGFAGDVTATTGLRLGTTDRPEKLCLNSEGRIVTDGIQAICAAGLSTVVIVWSTYMNKKKSIGE